MKDYLGRIFRGSALVDVYKSYSSSYDLALHEKCRLYKILYDLYQINHELTSYDFCNWLVIHYIFLIPKTKMVCFHTYFPHHIQGSYPIDLAFSY